MKVEFNKDYVIYITEDENAPIDENAIWHVRGYLENLNLAKFTARTLQVRKKHIKAFLNELQYESGIPNFVKGKFQIDSFKLDVYLTNL